MKTFEHEVLTFDANDKKSFAGMQETLRDWGAAGYEVVSVVGTSVNSSNQSQLGMINTLVNSNDILR